MQFPVYTFPLKISVFRRPIYPPKSSETKKEGQRVLRCPVSTVSLTADVYRPTFQGVRLPGYAPEFTDSAVALNKTEKRFFLIVTRLNGHRVFIPKRQLTNFEVLNTVGIKNRLSR